MSKKRVLLDEGLLDVVIKRLCFQLSENYFPFDNTVLIGIQPRGIDLLEAIIQQLNAIHPDLNIVHGCIDPTFYRDDFRLGNKKLVAHSTKIPAHLDGKKVVLIDDVLFTGRTIRAGIDALLEYGRPEKIDLLVLINRKFSRELPIEPLMIGKSVDHYDGQKVRVVWKSDVEKESQVLLQQENNG
ncbi:MAG: bifunctional pyr operon transcriptional regulator/uracil phosphoribosyltransferase PyrR [Bacteroidota bacterium]|jgi:pyrimidine operon attenuation protein/uracil phosphoribosyltransferase